MHIKSIIPALCLIVFFLVSCQPKEYFEDSGTTFHTLFRIHYESKTLLTEKIDAELQRFNLSMNPFNPNSIIAQVNNNQPVEVDDLFHAVFIKAAEVAEISGGAFDITCAPFINAWGFGFGQQDSLTAAKIDSMKAFVGYQKVRLEANRVIKEDPRLILNCSAIAKGYACDVIARLLEKEGVENYLVDIGGEVAYRGKNEQGACWSIGINKPVKNDQGQYGTVAEVFKLCGKGGLATSGNYLKSYEKDGKVYGHTIHPLTGYPVENEVLSATVLADDCMTADAWATVFMVLGESRTVELIKHHNLSLEYYLILASEQESFQMVYSEGLKKLMQN